MSYHYVNTWSIVHNHKYDKTDLLFNPPWMGNTLFRGDQITAMAADALAPSFTRSSAVVMQTKTQKMVLPVQEFPLLI